jgi:hypothetical protein
MKLALLVCVLLWSSNDAGECVAWSGQVVESNEEQGTAAGV